jgi:predicted acetyltransferase
MSLEIAQIDERSDALLRNLYEHYVHDMSEWLKLDVNENGKFDYDTSPFWRGDFSAFIAKSNGKIAGFAVVQSAEKWLGDATARDVKDFFVLRAHRGHSIANDMARFVWDQLPARWLVRVLPTNRPALPFWRRVVAEYSAARFEERTVHEKGRDWIHLSFDSSKRY